MDFPTLETERLILRAITPEDRYSVFENFSDPDVAKWFFETPFSKIEQADQIIRTFIMNADKGIGFTWAILLKDSGKFIGTCSYENYLAQKQGEIGFDLGKKFWGKGYMAEALREIINFGFTVLGLMEIEANTYSHNVNSKRLLEKLGFKLESMTDGSHYYILVRPEEK